MEKTNTNRRARATETHVAISMEKRRVAAKMERVVARSLRSVPTTNNAPFDILVGTMVGVEVKTLVDQKNSKITMHPESLRRKLKSARALKLKRVYTVVIDARGKVPTVYYRKGLGSFRLGSLLKVEGFKSLSQVVR